jgi:hypothetical protein
MSRWTAGVSFFMDFWQWTAGRYFKDETLAARVTAHTYPAFNGGVRSP